MSEAVSKGRENMRRSFAAELSAALAENGWERNPYRVPGAVADWNRRFPAVPIVDDGETEAGRGSTCFDKVRRVETDGIIRFDWLSEKTAAQENNGKIPTKFSLCTGSPATIAGVIEACAEGASYPTILVVAARNGGAYWLAANLGQVLREYGVAPIGLYPEDGYKKGHAPPLYVRWSAKRSSGVKRLENMRACGIPDEPLRVINGVRVGPGYFQYPELTVSLSSLGVTRDVWAYARSVGEIPRLLETSQGFGPGSHVTWEDMG